MKTVLLIDGSPMFRDFLSDKFSTERVKLDTAGHREGYTRIITQLPDLIIIEAEEAVDEDIIDLLEKKKTDPNAKKIPVVICGPVADRNQVALLADYNVIKYFTKPIKFDVFFDAVGKILRTNFSMDTTPCILDLHINGSIIFIEVAMGLNREKLLILKYRIIDLIQKHKIMNPKAILMLTNLQLNFTDGANLELLLNNISGDHRISNKNVKILSFDEFVKQLVAGHKEYAGMEVVQNLQDVMYSLLKQNTVYDTNEFLLDKVLNSDREVDESFVDTRSSGEKKTKKDLKIAVVDDDVVIRKLLQNTFTSISGETVLFEDGTSFIKAIMDANRFDFVILDLYLPDLDGIEVLKTLQRHNFDSPILVYSRAAEKEAVIQALSLGASSYLVKPQKPGTIINKVLEILNGKK